MIKGVSLLMLLLSAIVLAFMWGCSESNSPQDAANPNEPPDAGFEVAQKIFEDGAADFGQQQQEITMHLIDELVQQQTGGHFYKPTAEFSDNITVNILSQIVDGDWFVFTVSATIIDEEADRVDTILFQGIDSLRFHNSEGYTLQPDTTIDAVNARKHYDVLLRSSGDSLTATSHASYDFAGDIMREFVINGSELDSMSVFIDDERYICYFTATSDQTWIDVIIDEAVIQYDDCPPGGEVQIDATLLAQCLNAGALDSVTVNGAWSLDIVFDNGQATITFTIGDQEWTTTETCGGTTPGQDFTLDSAFVEEFEWYVDDGMMNYSAITVLATLGALAEVDTNLTPPQGSDSLTTFGEFEYVYSNGWHIFIIGYSVFDEFSIETDTGLIEGVQTFDLILTDSIRIYNDNEPMHEPDANADSIETRNRYVAEIYNSLGTSLRMNGIHELNIIGTPWDVEPVYDISGATIDSTRLIIAWGDFAQDPCSLTVAAQSVMEHVIATQAMLNGEVGGCPESGTIAYTLDIDLSCDLVGEGEIPYFEGNWQITETLNGSTATWVYEYEGQELTLVWDCLFDLSKSPTGLLLPKIRR